MRYKNNERGGALIMVLLLVLVFTILGMGLLTMNISAAKQFNKKEEQVQARHLAEMGILYYKAGIDEAVKVYSNQPVEYKYAMVNGIQVINQEKTLRNYYSKLCTAVQVVGVPDYKADSAISTGGSYKLTNIDRDCQIRDSDPVPEKMELAVKSVGIMNGVEKSIDAKVTISSGSGSGGGDGNLGTLGYLPQKPDYPANWPQKSNAETFDDIKDSNPTWVNHGKTKQNPFITSAFVEKVGGVMMPEKSDWTFKDNFLSGDFNMSTSGKDKSSKLTVNKDFYINGTFYSHNHTQVNVGRNFIVTGDVEFGTNFILNVGGNALFDWKVSKVQPDAKITIQKNAYFKNPLEKVNNNATFCVKGDIFLWKRNAWAPYLPTDAGYDGFAKSCLGTSTGEPFNWVVDSGVNAEYK